MIDFKLKWHPQFSIYNIENCDALFLGENDQFLIDQEEFEGINLVVHNQGVLSDYVFQLDDMAEQISRLERIDKLVHEEILTGNGSEYYQNYSMPKTSNVINKLSDVERNVYLLSELINENIIKRWVSELPLQLDVAIVIVDDYLNPNLIDLNKEFREKGKDWLLIKPVGQTPMIGPLFTQLHDAPCYQCLFTRMVQNKPVREWFRRQAVGASSTTVPILSETRLIDNTLDHFKQIYLKHFLDSDVQHATLYATHALSLLDKGGRHFVSRRPQCRVCGEPTLFDSENNIPICLKDGIKHNDVDGGYRSISRQETVTNIDKIISPITGIITELTEISEADESDKMMIFQAAYFQSTYQKKKITADTFVQLSLGKGVLKHQAMSSALGEALERQAAQFTGEESFIYSTVKELNHRAFLPQQLVPFSNAQYRNFAHYQEVSLSNPQWVSEYNETIPVHWTRGWSLSKEEFVYFPAAFCFANTPYDDHIYSLYTHNGNAAGNTQEEAILQGALELIERDAVAIWWYNQIPRPEISLAVIPDESRKIIAKTLDNDWDYWILDISNDIEVVSCVSVGQHKQTGQFVLGFGSHLDVSIACQRALTEMYQLITIKNKVTGPFDFDLIPAHPFLFPRRNTIEKRKADYQSFISLNIKEDILYLLKTLDNVGLELCVVNYSRPDIFLKTLKVIVPGLCHFWPQLDNQRLYAVPVKLGWLSKTLQENDLNPLELYL